MSTKHKKHTIIYRHTEGKYKDGEKILIDKKIFDDVNGVTIKYYYKHNDKENMLLFKSEGNGKYSFTQRTKGQEPIKETDLSFNELINKIRDYNINNSLKFAIDYFTELKQKGGQQACKTLHGGAEECKKKFNKCTYLKLEKDINKNSYISKATLSRIQKGNGRHSRKLSKKMSRKLSKKLRSKSSRINYDLPRSS